MKISELDFIGAACLALVTLAFGVFPLRRNIILSIYNAACSAILAVYAAMTFGNRRSSEWVVMTVGLLLYWFGLFAVRIILLRSVSLRLLINVGYGGSGRVAEEIGVRLRNMRTYRLVRERAGFYELRPFGRFMAFWMSMFYGLARHKS